MAYSYSENDYIYASARVRALENRLLGNEKLWRLCDIKTEDELLRALEDAGCQNIENGAEKALSAMLGEVFESVREMTGAYAGDAFDVFRYPYDCHNIKSIIKSEIRDRDPSPLMCGYASVPPEKAIEALREGDFEVFPENMAAAAENARENYAKSRDPKQIDVSLDRACYADMLALSEKAKIPAFTTAVRRKIDLTNIMSAVRLLKRPAELSGVYGGEYYRGILLPGGNIGEEALISAFSGGWEAMRERTSLAGYPKLAEKLLPETGLSEFEKLCDDAYMELFADVRYKVSGAEVVAAYIAAAEYQIKNLRILLSARAGGSSEDAKSIRERLRVSYVR